MAVIAPEPKNKKQKTKTSSKTGGWFLFLLLVIGVPFLAVKTCSSSVRVISSLDETIESAVESAIESVVTKSSTVVSNDVQSKNDNDVANESQMQLVQGAASSSRFDAESSYYYGVKPRKDKKGIYELTAPVVDGAGILSKAEYLELCDFILEIQKSYGAQIAVLIVPDMDGDSIESFSMRHAEKWQLGQKGVDNGALLTVAMEEHDVRIETGYGTEGTLTDAKCSRIIRNIIVPAFKKGNYSQGIIQAVKNMAGIIVSDSSLVTLGTEEEYEEGDLSVAGEFMVVIVLVILVSLLSVLKGFSRYGTRRGRFYRTFMGPMIFGSGSHSNHSGHSGGGFGGFSGGGGSFGGGGASGHW